MRQRILSVLTILVIFSVGCSLAGGGSQSGSNSSSNQKIAQAVDPKTQPIQISTTLDQNHAATATIGPEGGTLSTTGADGTRFTLDIPPKTLLETVDVSMIPITSFNGIPWKSGTIEAVQLEPEGQVYYGSVTLTIEPATAFPADQTIPIGASGIGQALYMPTVDPKSSTLTLKLGHFSSAGATLGYLADVAPWRQRLGGDVEARLNSLVAAEIAAERQAILMGQTYTVDPNFWPMIEQAWKTYVLQPRLAAAGQSCAAGKLAIETVIAMDRQAQLYDQNLESGVNLGDLGLQVGKVCVQEEYQLCKDQHIIHRMLEVAMGIQRQNELLGIPDTGQDPTSAGMAQLEAQAWDLARKCLTFRLEFTSNVQMSTAQGTYTAAVQATVKFQFNPNTLAYEGSGDLVPTSFSMKSGNCSSTTALSNGTFKVTGLEIIAAPPDASHPYGRTKALHLTYSPGQSTEVMTENCPGVPPATYPPSHLWALAFEALHNQELPGGAQGAGASSPAVPDIGSLLGGMGFSNIPGMPGLPQLPGGSTQNGTGQSSQDNGPTFIAQEWAVRGGDYFASKQWDLTVNLTTNGDENGTFKLYHTPE